MSLFKKAIQAAETTKPAAKKSNKKEVQIAGLRKYAIVDAAIKSLGAIATTLRAEVEANAKSEFMLGILDGTRPESFRGLDGDASASVELRKRGTNSALSEEEQALLKEHGIEPVKMVSIPWAFTVNGKYANDEALLEKVSAALEGIVPEDFFAVQQEKSKFVVDEKIVETVFKLPNVTQTLVDTVTCFALKPKLEVTDMNVVLDEVKKLIN